ncbi:Uncharacterised protein [Mycobacterium tuberculosis]|uniref:Uncharacterized protein n=1 Tax=Mycobacterium tuberculosis TaxID=1773 RepID=A0A916LBI9_MYCTX|nr:Uncharacterised protein [Mycobacterium tuberculosis]COW74773.1 Uncharacterised protein [Mycobacterium tuberculosis]COY40726.1 Uncharacterised protein [Mycobacterium tuberculosis]COY43076.1 Uncharacterised protein [Mycobacterium tuberculosis]
MTDTEDGIGGDIGAHGIDRRDTNVFGDPERIGDAGGIHQIVDQHGGDDLAAQLVGTDLRGEPFAQRRREITRQPGSEDILIR